MEKEPVPFNTVFPSLKLDDKIKKYFDLVKVERVAVNSQHTRMRIYILSKNLIRKSLIYKVEQEIKNQIFRNVDMDVHIVEHFQLSGSYTPENFFEAYKSSIELELRHASPLIKHCFMHTKLSFPDKNTIHVDVPDTIVNEERADQIKEYLEKIFIDRAGFKDAHVEGDLIKEEHKNIFEDVDQKIALKVAAVIKQNAANKEEVQEEKKLPESKDAKESRKRFVLMPNDPTVIYGKNFDTEPEPIESIGNDPRVVTIRGEVFNTEERETRSGRIIFTISVTDYTDSLRLKLWFDKEEEADYTAVFKNGASFLIRGMMDFDPYDRELMIKSVFGIKKIPNFKPVRNDNSPMKRVELHCHTKMSDMDGVSSATDIIKQAYHFGMKALAITDHGVVQAFPEAHKALGGKGGIPKDADFKVIYGMEGYLVDDLKNIVSGPIEGGILDDAVIFSLTTTGQSPYVHDIIEISARKMEKGKLTDEEFTTLVNPEKPIPFAMQTETGINDDMVQNSPKVKEAIEKLLEFSKGCYLVAYDADMEMNFLMIKAKAAGLTMPKMTYVDIPAVVRFIVPDIGRIRFKSLVKHFKVTCRDDMRAQPRAEALGLIWEKLIKEMGDREISTFAELNEHGKVSPERARNLPYYHIIMLAKNVPGKYNLYTLVSESHLHYFKRRPLIPRSLLNKYREGLILGSACSMGELYKAILGGASEAELSRIVEYYDYLEVQPTGNNNFLIRDPKSGINDVEGLRDINRRIVQLGEEFKKPVCATCDVHFLNPEDAIYRSIIQAGHGFKDEGQPPLYLHTTEEMLDEFSYLGEEKAKEIVITNTNLVASWIENISPIYPDKCPPSIPNSEQDLQNMCYEKAHRWYGKDLPPIVEERLNRELTSIIKNGYAVMYIIAQKLVKKSNDDGYLVGSRGSVGSSFVATMADITEVNPLPPHYRCLNPDCLYSDFDSEEPRQAHIDGRCGCDMKDAVCPKCGQPLYKDGFDIPFETFLGFAGNKEPDIDLNFSGDEQNVAQQYTEVIFGKGQTFKAGTIGTVADKTAYGYAMHYFEDKGISKRSCELERLAAGCTGVRRTTGQHPGGVVVLPKGMNINWFTPVQHPANDPNSPFITTHFDYHSIDSNLLKLDILGHDDPTIIRMLQDLTGTDPKQVSLSDKGVLSLFSSTEALGIKPEDIDGCELGTLGVPEFGTKFVMGMLKQTHPKNFSELIRISGLSHGTDVWLNNAQYYIEQGYCTLPTAICCRDDIMLTLINKGLDKEHSFKIMESVRKGRGLTPEQEKEMRDHGVEEWYIESCLKIKYMFPKAHAAAYVMNAFRIAYYKIHYPLAYYAAYFSIRLKTFDYETMCQGRDKLEYYADQIKNNPNPTAHEEAMLDDMRLVREMYARGFSFCKLDIYQAQATRCRIIDGKIMPRLNCIGGLGDSQAEAIEEEAKKGPFLSKDDFRERTHVSATIVDLLSSEGILGDIPESNQISLFDLAQG